MDGRMIRRLCVLGCLLGAAAGCKNTKQHQNLIGPMPAEPPAPQMVNMPLAKSKSLFGNSNVPTMPVEVAPPVSNKPASADALSKLADVQLESALDDRTPPGSKEALLDSARKGYQKALQQEPKSKAALRGMAGFYARTGDREKAVEMYKKYLTLHLEVDVAHEVAVAHARWKDMDGAVKWCDYALKIDPENRAVKKTMGFCLARAGKWDEAFAVLCQIMPEAQARHNLAGLLDHMGQTEASKAQLQLAAKAGFAPSAGFLKELEQPQNPDDVRQAGDQQPAP
jgi:tetratricopeptide (TPR) repeat protein